MKTRSLVEKLQKDIAEIEGIKKNRVIYNTRNMAVRGLLKTGAYCTNLVAFLLASTITMGVLSCNNMTPYEKDQWQEPQHVYEEISSLDEQRCFRSYDTKYDKTSLVFYSAWRVNTYGLYEREVIYFQINKDILESRMDELLKMSLEELNAGFQVIDVKTYSKPALENDDFKYEKEKIVVGHSFDNYDEAKLVDESAWREVLSVILYFAFGAMGGLLNIEIGGFLFKDHLKRIIDRLETEYPIIKEGDLPRLENKLALMKKNLALLEGKNLENDVPRIKVKRLENVKGEN